MHFLEGVTFLYTSVSNNLGNSLFSFTAEINFLTGNPILNAINPPIRLPKFPDGTENITFSFFSSMTRV